MADINMNMRIMKKVLAIFLIIALSTSCAFAGQDFAPNLWGHDPYNHPDSFTRDNDGDGMPNRFDYFDDQWQTPPEFRDYDHDGTPNFVDPYDNEWYLP